MTLKAFWLQSAAAAAFAAGAAVAGPVLANPIPPAATYADLLEPVPDAGARLAADDAMTPPVAHLELAKYQAVAHHHHHHHHSWRWYRDNGYYWTGSAWVIIPNYNHHHHARQWYYDNGYYWNGHAWMLRSAHHHHHHHHGT